MLARDVFLPYAAPGSRSENLRKDIIRAGKQIFIFGDEANQSMLALLLHKQHGKESSVTINEHIYLGANLNMAKPKCGYCGQKVTKRYCPSLVKKRKNALR